MLPKKTPDHYETADIIITSDDFIEAQWPRLTVSEQRVILYLLALVEKEDSDFKFYRIPVRKLGEILRSEDKNLCKEFDKVADGLMKKIITWSEPENQKKQHRAAWCAYAALSREEGFAEISYAPQLKPFLLSLRENFTPYELSAVIRLRNHYSLKIYRLLKYNRSNTDKSLTVSLDQLKEYLGINPGEYNHFGHFKTKVIVPAQKDISEKTDIKFSLEQIKESRKIKYIRFLLESNPSYKEPDPPLPGIMSLEEPSVSEKFPVSDKNLLILDPGASAILKEELGSSGADELDIPQMPANHSPKILRSDPGTSAILKDALKLSRADEWDIPQMPANHSPEVLKSDPGTSAILKEELESSGADERDIPQMPANHSPEVLKSDPGMKEELESSGADERDIPEMPANHSPEVLKSGPGMKEELESSGADERDIPEMPANHSPEVLKSDPDTSATLKEELESSGADKQDIPQMPANHSPEVLRSDPGMKEELESSGADKQDIPQMPANHSPEVLRSDPDTSAMLKEELGSSGVDERDIPEMLANHSPEVLRKVIENFRFIRNCMESGNEDLAENLSEYFKSLLPNPGRDFEHTDEYKTHLEAKEFRKRIQAEEVAAAYKKQLEDEYREFLTSEVRRLIRENPEQAAVFEKRAEAGLIDQARTNTFLARLYKHREKSPRWRRHVEMQTEFLMQEELLPSFDEWVKERKQ
ncbi:replication initiation protein [Desulfobacterales bacterium HSG2]|nr:replication initiation protein [Desulfobacterales bacterium HSG2]